MPSLTTAILDTSVVFAAADDDDRNHAACVSVLRRADLHLIIPTLVVAEAAYLIGRHLGARAEVAFLRSLQDLDVVAPLGSEWARIAEICEKYVDFPLGATDSSVVSLAERLNTDVVLTLDRRHFGAIKPAHVEAFRLLPEENRSQERTR
jgi:predicted nucleic acid-binding protein